MTGSGASLLVTCRSTRRCTVVSSVAVSLPASVSVSFTAVTVAVSLTVAPSAVPAPTVITIVKVWLAPLARLPTVQVPGAAFGGA